MGSLIVAEPSLFRLVGALRSKCVGGLPWAGFVETTLEGRQASDVNFERVSKNVPLSLGEQRKQFGFPLLRQI